MVHIREVVQAAFNCARDETKASPFEGGALHRERSRVFVEILRGHLRRLYPDTDRIQAFSKHNDEDTSQFGMSELLYDISVLQYDFVNSGRSGKELAYVTAALWLVESELEPNKREALYDFNKLVIGRAHNLLFIGPQFKRAEEQSSYLEVLGFAAKYCSGALCLALTPRPGDWGDEQLREVSAWSWSENAWSAL